MTRGENQSKKRREEKKKKMKEASGKVTNLEREIMRLI